MCNSKLAQGCAKLWAPACCLWVIRRVLHQGTACACLISKCTPMGVHTKCASSDRTQRKQPLHPPPRQTCAVPHMRMQTYLHLALCAHQQQVVCSGPGQQPLQQEQTPRDAWWRTRQQLPTAPAADGPLLPLRCCWGWAAASQQQQQQLPEPCLDSPCAAGLPSTSRFCRTRLRQCRRCVRGRLRPALTSHEWRRDSTRPGLLWALRGRVRMGMRLPARPLRA